MGFADSLKAPLPSATAAATYADQEERNDMVNGGFDENDPVAQKIAAAAMGADAEVECDDCCDVPGSPCDETDVLIQRVGTPILLKNTMTADECSSFRESVESDIAISEGFFTERTIVKFDKNARLAQLRRVSALALAKKANDPLYKKLMKVWKMERALEAKIYTKYKSKADQRAKKLYAQLRKSKSKTLRTAAQAAVSNTSSK